MYFEPKLPLPANEKRKEKKRKEIEKLVILHAYLTLNTYVCHVAGACLYSVYESQLAIRLVSDVILKISDLTTFCFWLICFHFNQEMVPNRKIQRVTSKNEYPSEEWE